MSSGASWSASTGFGSSWSGILHQPEASKRPINSDPSPAAGASAEIFGNKVSNTDFTAPFSFKNSPSTSFGHQNREFSGSLMFSLEKTSDRKLQSNDNPEASRSCQIMNVSHVFGSSNPVSFNTAKDFNSLQSSDLFGNSTKNTVNDNVGKVDSNMGSQFMGSMDFINGTLVDSNYNETNRDTNVGVDITVSQESVSSRRKHDKPTLTSSHQSVVSRLAKAFKIFRPQVNLMKGSGAENNKGLFTQGESVEDVLGQRANISADQNTKRGFLSPSNDAQKAGEFKKLVIKSTPSKFHSINTENVFKAKRRRIGQPSSFQHASCEIPEMEVEKDVSRLLPSNVELEPESMLHARVRREENAEAADVSNGYFCSPSIKELSHWSLDELSQVNDFIIGRVGYGQISYMHPVDLSQIFSNFDFNVSSISKELFGKIFKFENSMVRVYDHVGVRSPDMGYELNIPATVTLKASPKKCTISEHIKRLKNMTGMRFVTYDPVTYNWTFTVEHFSVWGLIDDGENEADEEDLARLTKLRKKQNSENPEMSVVYSNLYHNDSYRHELKRQKIERQTSGIPGGWNFNEVSVREGGLLSSKQGLVQHEIMQEVNAFREEKFAHAIAANASDITNDSEDEFAENQMDENFSAYILEKEQGKYDYLKRLVRDTPLSSELEQIVNEKAYEPKVNNDKDFGFLNCESSLATSGNWLIQLELANNFESALAPISLGQKTVKLALGSINDILFSDSEHLQGIMGKSSPKVHQLENGTKYEGSLARQFIQSTLKFLIVEERENGFPRLRFANPLFFSNLAARDTSGTSDMLALASILFDQNGTTDDTDSFSDTLMGQKLQTLDRKLAFSSWLKSYNVRELRYPTGDSLNDVFSQICLGNSQSACSLSMSMGNKHLASLISLIDSNSSSVKSIASLQVKSWTDTEELSYIPEPIVKIYRLLAGDFAYFKSELSEKILFGLYVYYANPAMSIEQIFENLAARSQLGDLGEVLHIYSTFQVSSASETACAIADSDLGKQLKWVMSMIMSLGKHDADHDFLKDNVALALGEELEGAQMWKEAIYVYSSIGADKLAEQTIRRVILKNADEIISSESCDDSFLRDVLKLPQTLLNEASAIYKRQHGDLWGSAEALIVAELWGDAHDLVCDALGPVTVIEENSALIRRLKSIVSDFPENGAIIPGWNQGAGFYVRYIDVLEASQNSGDVESVDLHFLLENAMNLKIGNSFELKVSYKILTKKLVELSLEFGGNQPGLLEKAVGLHLGENERNFLCLRLRACGLPKGSLAATVDARDE